MYYMQMNLQIDIILEGVNYFSPKSDAHIASTHLPLLTQSLSFPFLTLHPTRIDMVKIRDLKSSLLA